MKFIKKKLLYFKIYKKIKEVKLTNVGSKLGSLITLTYNW